MKRGTPDHPKTKMLSHKLKLRRWEAVGVLESLWHFTAQYAKRGDIGKWSNLEIASAIEWEGDPDLLIDALVECKLLDVSTTYRLLVHDWESHADQTTRRAEEVKKLGFARESQLIASDMLANASQPKTTPKTTPKTIAVQFERVNFPDGFDSQDVRSLCLAWIEHCQARGKPVIDPEQALTSAMRLFKSSRAFTHNIRTAMANGWVTLKNYEEPPKHDNQRARKTFT